MNKRVLGWLVVIVSTLVIAECMVFGYWFFAGLVVLLDSCILFAFAWRR
jgi:hypothetical protein